MNIYLLNGAKAFGESAGELNQTLQEVDIKNLQRLIGVKNR